jgi:hypothetical protein
MLNLDKINSIASLVLLILAYSFSITVNGCLQAWFLDKIGDPTAKDTGYQSLNPLVHLDLLGLFLLIMLRFGWLRPVPVDLHRLKAPYWMPKILLAYSIESIISILFSIICLTTSIILCGFDETRSLLQELFLGGEIQFTNIVHYLSNYSWISILLILFCVTSVFINLFMATLNLIYSTFRYIVFFGVENRYSYAQYADIILLIGPLGALIFLAPLLRSFIAGISLFSAYTIAYFLGISS